MTVPAPRRAAIVRAGKPFLAYIAPAGWQVLCPPAATTVSDVGAAGRRYPYGNKLFFWSQVQAVAALPPTPEETL